MRDLQNTLTMCRLYFTKSVVRFPSGGRGIPQNGLYAEAPPKKGTFFRLQVYERIGILLLEVYERVGKFVVAVCEWIKKGYQEIFKAVKKTRNFLAM